MAILNSDQTCDNTDSDTKTCDIWINEWYEDKTQFAYFYSNVNLIKPTQSRQKDYTIFTRVNWSSLQFSVRLYGEAKQSKQKHKCHVVNSESTWSQRETH